ncbi:M28 family metallopeptidase [Aurantiacibacter luteus]|uniref:Peptidase M28 n=1 Tax=Aurantiacibacter luteus TaxID=1581420 RepID=A0A0G9MU66_9SPHN|nr:M28 family metallopeptidase [Aurantiacibacter luteus]KLE34236.1 peptidase M28 [Aurantiacibacter luteus]
MIRTFAPIALLGLAACTTTSAPTATLDIPEIAPGRIDEAAMRAVVERLASDQFDGRAPGTPGEALTVAYITEQFRAAGLQPGNNGSWTQRVPFVDITGDNFAPLTIAGGSGSPMQFAYGDDWVGTTYREAPRIDLANSELVFVGYGINAPEKGWNDYAGVDMRGKTAVILVNDPDYATEGLDGPFNGRAMTYYGRWTYKFEEAARQGAAAALIIHDTFPAAYSWNVVESSWTGPQVYAQRADHGASQTMMNGWVQLPVAERIARAAGQDLAALRAAAGRQGFRAVPLGLTASTSFTNTVRSFDSQNVIGVLPGREAPEEYVLYTGHWDHLGRCLADASGDDICNGAVDNATGIAALVGLARANAAAGPARRSQVFLAVTGEESGLLGSDYYAANPVFPLAQTAGGLNVDALLPTGRASDVTITGGSKSQLDAFLASALRLEGRTGTAEPTPERGYYYRSDHFSMAKRGVPMLYIDPGENLEVGGTAAGAAAQADYTENRYHQPGDEYAPDWNFAGISQQVQLYYRLGRSLAMSRSWPRWNEGDEFRAVRDASCAAASANAPSC